MSGNGFDVGRAIGLAEARTMMRGRGGRRPSLDTVRRWANPKRGWHPTGRPETIILLRTVRYNGELLTMPEWVAQFEAERVRLGTREPAAGAGPCHGHAAAEARLDAEGVGGRLRPGQAS